MRIHIYLSSNNQLVPFNYQDKLVYAFHKWIGWNEYHDEISLYSLSWLKGARITKDGFHFPNGAKWFISCWHKDLAGEIMKGVMNDNDVLCGMKVTQVILQEEPIFSSKEVFFLASPILVRKYDEQKRAIHLTFKDVESNKYMTDTMLRKLKVAGLNYNINIKFAENYAKAKTKIVKINEIQNKANYCPVILEGDPEAIQFAWNVGIGHSTGCGFGAVN